MRVIWLLVGVGIGVAVGRNASAMDTPVFLAAGFGLLLAAVLSVWAAMRDRSVAVSSAVAVANASASAHLQAELAAQAQSFALAQGGSVYINGAPYGEGEGSLEQGASAAGSPARAPLEVVSPPVGALGSGSPVVKIPETVLWQRPE